ncbi:hypothetical protein LXL04_009044 [Taraxacum kok-saghyz]
MVNNRDTGIYVETQIGKKPRAEEAEKQFTIIDNVYKYYYPFPNFHLEDNVDFQSGSTDMNRERVFSIGLAYTYHGKPTNILPTEPMESVANMFGSQYVWPVLPYQLSSLGTVAVQNFEYHVLGSFENSYIPENPRTPPISYISQIVIPFKKPTSEPSKTGFETKQKTVHICTKKKFAHMQKHEIQKEKFGISVYQYVPTKYVGSQLIFTTMNESNEGNDFNHLNSFKALLEVEEDNNNNWYLQNHNHQRSKNPAKHHFHAPTFTKPSGKGLPIETCRRRKREGGAVLPPVGERSKHKYFTLWFNTVNCLKKVIDEMTLVSLCVQVYSPSYLNLHGDKPHQIPVLNLKEHVFLNSFILFSTSIVVAVAPDK